MDSWKDYFHFSRAERRGLVLLSGIMLAFLCLPMLLPAPDEAQFEQLKVSPVPTFEVATFKPWSNTGKGTYDAQKTYSKTKAALQEPFPFDPNTCSKADFMALGFPEWLADRILKYREKGGKFREKADLKKVYGMPEDLYNELEPYIQITPSASTGRAPFPQKEKAEIRKIDINKSAVEDWQQLPGIGPGYANRIVKFRTALGGFVHVAQVAETFALPDSVFQRIKPYLNFEAHELVKIDLNQADEATIDAHPYLHKGHAKAIIKRRTEKGPYKSVGELQLIDWFDKEPSLFKKVEPYLKI